jgi:TATA-binding protein-associated factor Taf7
MEAQKTLDYRTFFKSTDVSQLLYVHNKWMDNFGTRTAEEVLDFARAFNPLAKKEHDPEFYNNLYRRTELHKQVTDLLGE